MLSATLNHKKKKKQATNFVSTFQDQQDMKPRCHPSHSNPRGSWPGIAGDIPPHNRIPSLLLFRS